MKITPEEKARMNSKFIQLFRFIVLNLKILSAVGHSKKA